MKVVIKVAGRYSTFEGTKRGAEKLEVGDERTWPDDVYAQDCIDAGMVKAVVEVKDMSTAETIVAEAPQTGVERYKNIATTGAVQMADKFGLDLATVEPTGKGGKITVNDVRLALAAKDEPKDDEVEAEEIGFGT